MEFALIILSYTLLHIIGALVVVGASVYLMSVVIRLKDYYNATVNSPINQYILTTFKSRTLAYCAGNERSKSNSIGYVTPDSTTIPDLVIEVWVFRYFIWPSSFVYLVHNTEHISMIVSTNHGLSDPRHFCVNNHDEVCAAIDEALNIIFK